ncbi:MAG: sulfate reduction electron transfer complex DsrMKJOP subunit DsrO [Candidatus Geothermarchaeales archaeon]
MRQTRRSFLQLLVIGGAAVAATSMMGLPISLELPEDTRKEPGKKAKKWVMVIDLKRCDGCGSCTAACTMAHFVPRGQEWIKVFKMRESSHTAPYYFVRPCMQCENAPCVNVCPVGASYHREDGVVLINHETCIGCRLCMAACPYGARYFNWEEPEHTPEELNHTYSPEEPWPHRRGVVEKCMFCAHLADEGRLPVCVIGCPMKAIYFGDLNEDAVSNGREIVKFSELVEKNWGYRFREELGTEPRVYYLPPRRG